MGLPLPFLSNLLSIGGKSLAEYTYFFLVGYYVFADEKIVSKLEKCRLILFAIGFVACILNVYLFLWANQEFKLINDIARYVSKWFMVIALIGALLSTVVVFFLYKFTVGIIASKMLMVKLVAPSYVFVSLLWKYVLSSIVIGGVASFAALRKFLVV